MSQLTRHLLLWSHTQFKSLHAVHIPGKLNLAADALSRQLTFSGGWRLHPETIRMIWRRFGEAQVDLLFAPHWPTRTWFPELISLVTAPPWPHSSEDGPPLSGARHHMAPTSRSMEPPCVAPGRDAADSSGLPPAVVETITQARAPSTRQTYVLKLSLFAN